MKMKKKLLFFILFLFFYLGFTSNATNINSDLNKVLQDNKTNEETITKNTTTKKASKKIDISNDFSYWISLNQSTYEYTGKPIEPKFTIYKSNSLGQSPTILKQNIDYTVSYKNNININSFESKIIITGIGKYTGSREVSFSICKYSIAKATISKIPDQEYTGKSIKPKPYKVMYKNKLLKENVDYKLYYSYENSTTPMGTIYFNVVGIGEFSGYQNLTFNVVPSTVKNVGIAAKSNGFKIYWDKANSKNIDGYTIFRTTSTTKNLEYKELATISTDKNFYLDTTPVTTGKTYYYKVCTYKIINETK